MNTSRLHRRTLPQLVIGLFLLVTNITPGIANGVKLQAFEADYSLHIEGLHVGNSKITLAQSDNLWQWQTISKPRGVYKILSDKNPYSETRFALVDGRHLIQRLLLSDEGNKNFHETAHFDWQTRKAQVLRDKVTSVLTVDEDIYDYNSINWLAANMMNTGKTEQTVDFYIKGQIVKSIVKRLDNQDLKAAGQTISAWVYEQTTEINESRFKYYFDPAKPLLPIKIEKLKPDRKTSILLLKSATWH